MSSNGRSDGTFLVSGLAEWSRLNMDEEPMNIVDRVVDRLPMDRRLARLAIEATIEEISRLMTMEDNTIEAIRHVFRNVSPVSAHHLFGIMQCALAEVDVDYDLYEGTSQRMPTGRKLMLATVEEWLDDQPVSRQQIDAARREGRRIRDAEDRIRDGLE